MSKKRYRRTNLTSHSAVVGNTAVAYEYEHEAVAVHQDAVAVQRPVKKTRKRKNHVSMVYSVVMLTMLFLLFLICVMMLKARFTVAATADQVIELKKELTAMQRENAHLESIVHEELDLVEIRRIAMEEYGMVYPSDTDVIYIEPEVTSYTVQYKTIEKPTRQRASLGNILAFVTRDW